MGHKALATTESDTSWPNAGPSVVRRKPEDIFEAILAELRAIRIAVEKPRETAERENTEFLKGVNSANSENA